MLLFYFKIKFDVYIDMGLYYRYRCMFMFIKYDVFCGDWSKLSWGNVVVEFVIKFFKIIMKVVIIIYFGNID